ncbi:MAG: hypothetical protein QGH40_11820 [bacterium]|nr:hypothetical protein [bacterium]
MSDQDRNEIEKYIGQLKSEDQGARVEAARELGRFDGEDVESALEKLLGDENFVLQAAAEKTLERIYKRKKIQAEERKKLEEQRAKEKAQEPKVDLSLLSEEDLQRIREEELTSLEEEKNKQELEQKKHDEQRRREDAERLKDKNRRQLEEDKKKAEELLREKIRKEASTQIGLVEYEGEMLTPEEVERRNDDKKQKEATRRQAIQRKRKREEANNREIITSQKALEKIVLHVASGALIVFGICLLVTVLDRFLHFVSKGASLSVFGFLVMSAIIFSAALWQIHASESKINKARIITIDKDIWSFDVELSQHPIATIVRRIIFSSNPILKTHLTPNDKESKE